MNTNRPDRRPTVDDTEYRIEFTITRRQGNEDDFVEIGFGSSGAWENLDDCTHSLGSAVSNGEWETEPGMPDPDDVMADIAKAGEGR